MEGYDFTAMGAPSSVSAGAKFSGSFYGDTKPGGGRYTISNLNIVPAKDGNGQPLTTENVAFFQVGSGCSFSNLTLSILLQQVPVCILQFSSAT
jgi:hypothetical protein